MLAFVEKGKRGLFLTRNLAEWADGNKQAIAGRLPVPRVASEGQTQGGVWRSEGRIIRVERRQKKPYVGGAGLCTGVIPTARPVLSGTSPAGMRGFTWKWRGSASPVGGAAR